MRFEASAKISFPVELVVSTLLPRMEELVPHLPNISAIETRVYETLSDGRVKTVRHWQGTASTVPSVLRPFVTKNSLGWVDTSIWDLSIGTCEWFIETAHSRFISCSGTHAYLPDPEAPTDHTVLRIEGEFTAFGDKIPGMPGFLGKRVAPALEKVIVGFMMPNFTGLAVGAEGLLRQLADEARAAAADAP